ncbi:prolyl oligopeptidase family serine peptidase [Mucilaginibacter sp. RS28]|uniref:Prolyl oligopeptidase family serine peptidase n=1 Tax=Mucilaginibacter straminoryzae TaxID=2932774 RepID=A0A9X1X7V6_9SPHI|nr:prolyl oligopeptidase family serine peptidase [Mucilaginibacter straminoryzae]MCJ8211780.1 prolyl oligopeptidase family serine peptidase [Mucilaginibacter straminoryzae]
MNKIFTFLLLAACGSAYAQTTEKLSVEKIMRDPKWMGTAPSNIRWSDDGKKVYFMWNPEAADRDALYSITTTNLKPEKVGIDERKTSLPGFGIWNKQHTRKLYEQNGDIYLLNLKGGIRQLTNTVDRESNPVFSSNESKVIFVKSDNLFSLNLNTGELVQLTNITHGAATAAPVAGMMGGRRGGGGGFGPVAAGAPQSGAAAGGNQQDRWLKAEQLELFDVIKEKDRDQKADAADRKALQPKRLKEIAVGDQIVSMLTLSPDERYVTYRLIKQAEGARVGNVPNYVTASGYTEDIANRTKVGSPQPTSETFIFDKQRDTVYSISTKEIPGIKDLPDYVKDYPKQLEQRQKLNADRKVTVYGPFWAEDGKNAVAVVTAQDNKDRWIMKVDPETGKLSLLDRQRDEAWIGGPGIGGAYGAGTIGWVDNTHLYYQSEATGYSHIYVVDVTNGTKKQLTSGKWEVQQLDLSNDKKTFYFIANVEHPGITNYYCLPVTGGTPVKLTSMKGGNEVELSPDEKWLAIRYSYSNKPWELYLQPNKAGAKAVQVTNSVTAEFKAYPWREPQVITFKNRYGSDVYARLYVPANPAPSHPAVVFVHGAGYLQNVHYYWSQYFREYMFNNLLTDMGYTVLDVDYTGSSGYGRDWRTGIYRHMGGKDLTDQVDGVKMLVDKYGVNPKNVGLYGGSYGGFITLMAMFTQPDVFAAGGALRSVTDWAHYNHGYTANILNEPYNDEKAYKQSSPIYFANGLKGNLLMAHGMVDQNVNFQDIVRLTQRLIELHKDNWSLAPYPVEDHGFTEPSSWADEYKRILKLFEETLKK